jgi:hypothetical protein
LLVSRDGRLGKPRSAGVDTKNAVEAANRLANDSHRLAGEAKRSADNTVKTAEYQLRAYVDIVDNNILKCPLCNTVDIDRPIALTREQSYQNVIIINLQNSGETPAYNIHAEDAFWSTPQ